MVQRRHLQKCLRRRHWGQIRACTVARSARSQEVRIARHPAPKVQIRESCVPSAGATRLRSRPLTPSRLRTAIFFRLSRVGGGAFLLWTDPSFGRLQAASQAELGLSRSLERYFNFQMSRIRLDWFFGPNYKRLGFNDLYCRLQFVSLSRTIAHWNFSSAFYRLFHAFLMLILKKAKASEQSSFFN